MFMFTSEVACDAEFKGADLSTHKASSLLLLH